MSIINKVAAHSQEIVLLYLSGVVNLALGMSGFKSGFGFKPVGFGFGFKKKRVDLDLDSRKTVDLDLDWDQRCPDLHITDLNLCFLT